MISESRTKNATRNAGAGAIAQIFTVLIEFAIRTVFIKMLGTEYLGVNGLFTNILTVLSFAELGIGNAIVFSMYRPIAICDKEKIKSLIRLYKKAYTYIGIAVFVIGLAVTPFLREIIKEVPNIKEKIEVIYILFVLNTTCSYLFMYKKSIILANQKAYIVNLCKLASEILKATLQIIILLIFKNFVAFLIVQIICTILDNILATLIANRMYTYIEDKDVNELEKKEKSTIFTNVKSLVLYKFGSIILNGTDNIIISKMLGLKMVGIVSNFQLLITTVNNIIGNALNGFTASVGNLNLSNDSQKKEDIFKQLFILSVWIYGFCSIAFLILSNDFVKLWIGKEYMLPLSTIIALVLHLYVNGVQFAGYTYRTTMGLFVKGKYCPIVAALINIVLSIVLCKYIGVTGIILATSISRLLTTTWYDIYMVYKYGLEKSPFRFYIKYTMCMLSITIIAIVSYYVIGLITLSGIYGFALKVISCAIIPNLLLLLVFYRTDEYRQLTNKIKEMIWKKKRIKTNVI